MESGWRADGLRSGGPCAGKHRAMPDDNSLQLQTSYSYKDYNRCLYVHTRRFATLNSSQMSQTPNALPFDLFYLIASSAPNSFL